MLISAVGDVDAGWWRNSSDVLRALGVNGNSHVTRDTLRRPELMQLVKTIVLGAGASRAESESMPLVNDFFQNTFARFPFDDPAGVNFLQSVGSDFGVTPDDIRTDRLNIEELLTLLDCDAAWHSGEIGNDGQAISLPQVMASLAARSTLSYLMSGLLFDAQRTALSTGASLHRRIAERLDADDTIISYNYDLLMEFGLASVGKFSPSAYQVPFHGELDGAGVGYAEVEPYTPTQSTGIDILKLHGSLNWLHRKSQYRPTATDQLPVNAVAYLRDAFHVEVPAGSSGKIFSLLDTTADADHQFVELVPVIVAPTFDKAIVWGGFAGVLRSLWRRAHAALRVSEHVAIIGYALRDADFQSMWLFRTALAASIADRNIWIVNPSPYDRDRLARIFTKYGNVNVAETVDDYLTATLG